jgi:hypothetical protein
MKDFHVDQSKVRGYVYTCSANKEKYANAFPSLRVKTTYSEERLYHWLKKIKTKYGQERHVLVIDRVCSDSKLMSQFFTKLIDNIDSFGQVSLIVNVTPSFDDLDTLLKFDRIIFSKGLKDNSNILTAYPQIKPSMGEYPKNGVVSWNNQTQDIETIVFEDGNAKRGGSAPTGEEGYEDRDGGECIIL